MVQLFSKAEDPDIPGHVILEQFQAQVGLGSSSTYWHVVDIQLGLIRVIMDPSVLI